MSLMSIIFGRVHWTITKKINNNSSAMEFIESERGNQKLKIKQ
jgi:hypothetical protein